METKNKEPKNNKAIFTNKKSTKIRLTEDKDLSIKKQFNILIFKILS